MSDKKYSEQLLLLARKDILALKGMLENKEMFHDEVFGFHAQQAVEKSLKALLCLNAIEFRKTHDLSLLFNQIFENKFEIPDNLEDLQALNDFAVEYRYDLFFEEEGLNRREILEKVNDLFLFVEKKITNKV
ncbi:MAG: HEPN domain-containing protein [Ignavibacteriales bacterium]|nr:HEPN domain-containing protein [Ignavibacteriales bacterium]